MAGIARAMLRMWEAHTARRNCNDNVSILK